MKIFLLMFVVILFSCAKEITYKSENAIEVSINEIPEDIKIPTKIWDLMEEKDKSVTESAHGEKKSETHGEPAKEETHGKAEAHGEKKDSGHGAGKGSSSVVMTDDSSHVVFASVKVFLKEKNQGVLKSPSYIIELPRGGGEVDLANYIGEQSGTFYVGFELPDMEIPSDIKTIFVSRTKKRKIDGEIFGAGCNKFFDISKKMQANMAFEGIKVNTNRNRHDSVVGGNFIFSTKKGTQVFVTQVTFIDSKNKFLFCEEEN